MPILSAGYTVEVEGGHAEHFTRPFGIGSRDDGRMHIDKAPFMKELVDGVDHRMTYAVYGAEGVGARPEMGDFAKKLQRMPFWLEWIFVRMCVAQYLDGAHGELYRLSFSGRLHDAAPDGEAGSCSDAPDQDRAGIGVRLGYCLNIFNGRSVIDCNEQHIFAFAPCSHPSHYERLGSPMAGRSSRALTFILRCIDILLLAGRKISKRIGYRRGGYMPSWPFQSKKPGMSEFMPVFYKFDRDENDH
jgi:hypothetical protein